MVQEFQLRENEGTAALGCPFERSSEILAFRALQILPPGIFRRTWL